jgi:hypothetical protein
MVNLQLTAAERLDTAPAPAVESVPEYPWGLRIVLTQRELPRLGLAADCAIGDTLEFRASARVTGVNRTEGAMGPEDRVELQITDMAIIDE